MKYLPFVNIKQGTASVRRFSNGNTLPLTQLPFAMAGFSPQTRNEGGWFYHPADRALEGLRLTHRPSPWIGDYGAFLFTPQFRVIHNDAQKGWSSYRPEESEMTPAYQRHTFLRSRTTLEVTPTERGAKLRVTFPDEEGARCLSIFGVAGHFAAVAHRNVVTAYTDGQAGHAKKFQTTLVLRPEQRILSLEGDSGKGGCCHLYFEDRVVDIDLAISYLGEEQARENLRQDCADKTFEDVRAAAEAQWEDYLGRIAIETEDEEMMRCFYSCLYHTALFPHKAYERTATGKPVHYCPTDGKQHDGVRYTDNGFWDTYRTEFPLLFRIAPDEAAEMLDGFLCDYTEGGWLPRWPSIGERGCMPSTLLDAILADAAVKGVLKDPSLQTALAGMLHHATEESGNPDYGREGCRAYLRCGYVPSEECRSSVNLTVDAAYGDYCIAVIAGLLGREDIRAEYLKRSENWKNLFDKETGFLRPKNRKGAFLPKFDPLDWGGAYTEGGAWQTTFSPVHDLEGLAALYGGKEKMLAKLDELFATPPDFNVGAYKEEIHEMSEMAAADFGQCAISNQPSFALPYLYAALGEPAKTEYWVERICREAFSAADDGFPGDEDNGATAAWYVLSVLGIYDVCPGKGEEIRIRKLCDRAVMRGKEI
ncbi:MAG: GH92 family glycosyl hydrolase [Clostridia bacterium]|nr:GH92 family glycosyl hydrolase [Clostridia bacterium]